MSNRMISAKFVAGVTLLLCMSGLIPAESLSQPIAAGKGKFVGSSMSDIRGDFSRYWNQVTPENAGKWGSVEGSQGNYNWTTLGSIYDYAITNSFVYKHHNLIWGQQQPSFITTLDSAGQRAEVEAWIQGVAAHSSSASFVDVVNEPFHAPPPYINALGGTGKTGYDWVITAFQLARNAFFPGVKLLVNEYNILQDNNVTAQYGRLIDTLKVRHLIDGIGIQGHYFEFRSPAASPGYLYPISTLKSNLDMLTSKGLPVYISEFDINEPVDSIQLQNYKTYFPLFWEEPGVAGITLWGYGQGDIWKTDAYLVRTNGSERPALQWLRRYVAIPLLPLLVSPVGTSGEPRNPRLNWRSTALAKSYRVQVSSTGTFSSVLVDSTLADTTAWLSPLAANAAYYWHVSAINDSGASTFSPAASFTTGTQVTSVGEQSSVPGAFSLSQNYPDPFNPSTTIEFSLPGAETVTLIVYDLLGREVRTLAGGTLPAGAHSVQWDGRDSRGTPAGSGVYFYRLTTGSNFSAVKKMIVMR